MAITINVSLSKDLYEDAKDLSIDEVICLSVSLYEML